MPVERAVGRQVLVRVPEGAVIDRVHRHRGVVAPTVDGKGLNTRPRGQRRLPLRQRAEWVAGQPAGQRDAGVDCVADDAVAGGDVSARVHGRRTHPSIPGVWGEGALLIQRGRAAGIADLVPPDAARGAAALARVHAVAGDQRLVVSEVTVGDPVHQPISKGGQWDARRGLRHARGESAAELAKWRDRNHQGTADGRVGRRDEVGVQAPFVEARVVGTEGERVARRAGGRWGWPVLAGGQQALIGGAQAEHDHDRRPARQHRASVEGRVSCAREVVAVLLVVVGQVVGVRPDRQLGVVGELRTRERIAVVSTGRVACRGDGDAVEVGHAGAVRAGVSELREEPAVRGAVVEDDRVAAVRSFAKAGEAGPDRADRLRAEQQSARPTENGQRRVRDLDLDGRPDRGVHVGRFVAHDICGDAGADAFERAGKRRPGRRGRRGLQHGIAGDDAGGRRSRVRGRMGRNSGLVALSWVDPMEIAKWQGPVVLNGPNHLRLEGLRGGDGGKSGEDSADERR